MTKSKWKITTIILLTAVFVSLIVLLVIQSVNNSRLLDYLLEYTVKDVTYSRSGDLSLVCTTYSRNSTETKQDDGIALTSDVSGDLSIVENTNEYMTLENTFAVDGRLLFKAGRRWEMGDYENDTATLFLRTKNNQYVNSFVAGSVTYSHYIVDLWDLYNKGKIDCGVEYEIGVSGRLFDAVDRTYVDVNVVACTFSLSTSMALPEPPVKLGYDFTGWYTDEACTQPYTDDKVTGDVKLYAGFTPHNYEIRFNANSGVGTMENLAMTYDQYVNLPESAFTKEHYNFVGWSLSAGGNVKYTDAQSVKNLSAKDGAVVDLFAVWERSEWLVTFDNDGEITSQYVNANGQAVMPAAPMKEGYVFEGWYFVNGIEFTNQRITKDTLLKAKYSPIQCEVRFYLDGVEYGRYYCNYGTNISELLKATGVNRVLYKVSPAYEVIDTNITSAVDVPLEKTSVGEVMDEATYKWLAPVVISVAVLLVMGVIGTVIYLVTKRS